MSAVAKLHRPRSAFAYFEKERKKERRIRKKKNNNKEEEEAVKRREMEMRGRERE